MSPDLGHAHISQVLAEMFSLSQGFKAKALLFLKIEAPERADAVSGGLGSAYHPPASLNAPVPFAAHCEHRACWGAWPLAPQALARTLPLPTGRGIDLLGLSRGCGRS